MSHVDEINEAIASHGFWKFHLKQAIETGESDWTVPQLRRNDACAFGEWLSGLPAGEQTGEHWREIHDLHTQIHTQAADVLQLAFDGKKEDAQAALAFGSPFSVTSAKLTAAMTAWRNAQV